MVHVTHHKATGKLKMDNFNISFIRYFRMHNFLLAAGGSIIGCLILLNYGKLFAKMIAPNINSLYTVVILGGLGFFGFLAAIAHLAGNSARESCRLAGRRGLFTFATMLIIVLISLGIAGKFSWDMKFGLFLKELIAGMILTAFFAVPLDYGVSYSIGRFKKKATSV